MTKTTRITRFINAPRQKIYKIMLDPELLAQWKVPDDMQLEIHQFEPRQGGKIRISLMYQNTDNRGKTSAHTDTYHGYFAELIPNEKIVEIDEFETEDPSLQGSMRITIMLNDTGKGTNLVAVHEDLPEGLSEADNHAGWEMSLTKLAGLAEKA